MKKILVLFGLAAFLPMSAMAYIIDGDTSSINLLKLQGFSDSTLQIVDWTRYSNQGVDGSYVRYFQPKKNGRIGRLYQNAKVYLDPIQDNGKFGEGDIEFSNTWMGNETHYSSDYTKNSQIEKL